MTAAATQSLAQLCIELRADEAEFERRRALEGPHPSLDALEQLTSQHLDRMLGRLEAYDQGQSA